MTRDGALLAIEASNPSLYAGDEGSVAVVAGGVVTLEPMRAGSRHDDAIQRTIDRACRRAGVSPRDIARIAVSVGPGGYTGVRVAVTTAKMLGEALGAGLVGVPTASAVACGVVGDGVIPPRSAFVVLLASKRDTVWAQAFVGERAVSPGGLVDAAALGGLLGACDARAVFADAQLPSDLREAAARAGASVRVPRLDAALCACASEGLSAVGVDMLAPIYPREPEAVSKWRERSSPDRR